MAVDEVLLDWCAEQGTSVLRFYGWSVPTLSLGYFQNYQERLGHGPSRDSAVVRRSSGGGAILHDRELTYSLVMPGEHALADDSSWLYTAVHQALIETLSTWGIEAAICRPTEQADQGTRPFLCFERRATGDVLLGSAKICGSAQRRRRGAILQHGSLVFGRSSAAPEILGLRELAGTCPDQAEVIARWPLAIGQRLKLRLEKAVLEPELSQRAQRLVGDKYGTDRWTQRR